MHQSLFLQTKPLNKQLVNNLVTFFGRKIKYNKVINESSFVLEGTSFFVEEGHSPHSAILISQTETKVWTKITTPKLIWRSLMKSENIFYFQIKNK